MKTAQRILATSLELFNEHGETSVTSVDIANELDISPGNLYYHFKGKEFIVDALFDLHFSQMEALLASADTSELTVEERFYYFYLVLEKLHLYRFFYRSPRDLIEKYPDLEKGLERLVKAIEARLLVVISQASALGDIEIKESEIPSMVELISMIMLQSSQYYQIKRKFDEDTQIYSTLGLLLSLLMPRITIEKDHLSSLQQAIAIHAFAQSD